MPVTGTEGRIARTRAAMAAKDIPALLVTQIDNVGWLSGFSGSAGIVLLSQDQALFATDSRYTVQAAAECPDFRQLKLTGGGVEEVLRMAQSLGQSRIGFEAGHLTYRGWETYRDKLPEGLELVPTSRLVEDLRLVKDAGELGLIEYACGIADRAFARILPMLKPGATERDIMLELEWTMRREGADIAFDSIVVSGKRSALPHGHPTDKQLEAGDFVTMDFGARWKGYCSDITRTVMIGKANDEQCAVYATVRDALERAIESIHPGVGGKEVDTIARDIIGAAGHAEHFGHGLGHSLGRVVHDGPGLASSSTVVMQQGMVMTVEPGIYIPEKWGIRIEQDVVVTDEGCRILTQSPTELLEL